MSKGPLARLKPWELLAALSLLVVLAVVFLPALARSREASRRSSCVNNLKQMGVVFKMYANESRRGAYPPVGPVPGNWMPDLNALYPEYLSDLDVLVCPSSPYAGWQPFMLHQNREHPAMARGQQHPDCVSSLYYNYTGYAITNDETALGLYQAYYSDAVERFGQGDLEVDAVTWANSDGLSFSGGPPVMWDRVSQVESELSHTGGINVLHLDGSVRFVPYSPLNNSSNFPATLLAAETFGADVPRLSMDCY